MARIEALTPSSQTPSLQASPPITADRKKKYVNGTMRFPLASWCQSVEAHRGTSPGRGKASHGRAVPHATDTCSDALLLAEPRGLQVSGQPQAPRYAASEVPALSLASRHLLWVSVWRTTQVRGSLGCPLGLGSLMLTTQDGNGWQSPFLQPTALESARLELRATLQRCRVLR